MVQGSAVLLVNPNRMRPPIAPVGLEYVATALEDNGYAPILCDLAFEPESEWRAALDRALAAAPPLAVGVSIRNIDDAYFASRDFVLRRTRDTVRYIIENTKAPVVLGGIGFSCAPREILRYTGAPLGIVGDGEQTFVALLDRLANNADLADLPGVIESDKPRASNTTAPRVPLQSLDTYPLARRRFVDNPRYFREGGQIGLETKRGCDQSCVYCIDPVGKGRCVRPRPTDRLVAEFEDLLAQGIDVFHLCDSEFNIPPDHAHAVCNALVAAGLGSRMRWYAYASPLGFDEELAQAMAWAGGVGVNFGVDHADPGQLERLGRRHGPEDLRRTAAACRKAGLTTMFDMLFGGPGETPETMRRGIEFVRALDLDRIGFSCGVRVYPHTRLAEFVRAQGPLDRNPNLHGATRDNDDLLEPVFYVDAAVGVDIHKMAWELAEGDPRVVVADPAETERNYNYNDNAVLESAIRDGARGAYWDILRKRGEAS